MTAPTRTRASQTCKFNERKTKISSYPASAARVFFHFDIFV